MVSWYIVFHHLFVYCSSLEEPNDGQHTNIELPNESQLINTYSTVAYGGKYKKYNEANLIILVVSPLPTHENIPTQNIILLFSNKNYKFTEMGGKINSCVWAK